MIGNGDDVRASIEAWAKARLKAGAKPEALGAEFGRMLAFATITFGRLTDNPGAAIAGPNGVVLAFNAELGRLAQQHGLKTNRTAGGVIVPDKLQ